ncbi:MAG: alkaline phosphatase [Psychrobium sp.]
MRLRKSLAIAGCVSAIVLGACTTIQSTPESAAATKKSPKNVILMVSDGIGFNGWLATDYYQGLAGKQAYQVVRPDGTMPRIYGLSHSALNLIDKDGKPLARNSDVSLAAGAIEQGYNPNTRWNKFENAMLNDFDPIAKSYTSYTDSAAAGTALMSGRKTSVGRINKDWTGQNSFKTIAQLAMESGRSAGVVTSVMISHATPAAAIAHNASRNNYADIFNEMVQSDLTVLMGAGHPLYNGSDALVSDDKRSYKYLGGEQTYRNLTQQNNANGFRYIDDKASFKALANGDHLPQRVVGIARSGSTLQASREGLSSANTPSGMAYNQDVPTLATMSQGALNVLAQKESGFFLMIEGGAVDWMGHANDMPRFIEEHMAFNQAVSSVIEWVEKNSSWDETLLIITSDHECGGIWGQGTWTNHQGGGVATDRSKSAIVSARFNPQQDTFNDFIAVQDHGAGNMPGYQFASGNHTNELVPLWAIGAGSEYFEQFTRTDLKAHQLWGKPYQWNGNYVDNTTVFDAMNAAISSSR